MSDMGEPMDDIAAMIVEAPAKQPEQVDIVQDAQLRQVDDAEAEAVTGEPPVEEEAAEVDLSEADDAEDEAEPAEPVEAAAEDVTDDDDNTDEQDAEPAEALHTVKVDGKPQLVTYDELLRGYSGQSHIQQGLMDLKEQKQQLAEAAEYLQNERDRILALSQQFQNGQMMQAPPQPPSRDMLHSDPIGYMEAKEAYEDQMRAYERAQADLGAMQQQADAQKEYLHRQKVDQQMRLLVEAIPEFGDPQKAPVIRDKMIAAGGLYGFSDAEMRAQDDARYIRVLNDAMKFLELQAGRRQAEKKADTRPTNVVKPGVKKSSMTAKARQAQTAQSRMRKFGSVDDVANFLLS